MGAVYVGDNRLFSALALGRSAPSDTTFFQQLKADAGRLSAAGQQWINNATQFIQQNSYVTAQRLADSIRSRSDTMVDDNIIRPLLTVEQLQHASAAMIRYVMANPTIRQEYQKQRCDGYSHIYPEMDLNPTHIGDAHYEYRRVVEEIVQDDPETGGCVSYHFSDDLYEGDRPLTLDEKQSIMQTWFVANAKHIRGQPDTTDVENNTL